MDTLALSRKIAEKYNLKDNGMIHSWAIGLCSGHDKRKIYKRIFNLKNERKNSSTIKLVHIHRIRGDQFSVFTVVFSINTSRKKAERILYLFRFGFNVDTLSEVVNISRVLYYKVDVSIISTRLDTRTLNISKRPNSVRKNNFFECSLISTID